MLCLAVAHCQPRHDLVKDVAQLDTTGYVSSMDIVNNLQNPAQHLQHSLYSKQLIGNSLSSHCVSLDLLK